MPSTTTPPTFHRLPSNGSGSDSVLYPHYVDQNEEPSSVPMNAGSETHFSGRGPHPPTGFGGWETVEMTPGATYLDSRSGHNLLLIAHEFIYQDMGQPAHSYPLNQMANIESEDVIFGMPDGMEHGSMHEVPSMDRSPSMPSSASPDCDAFTTWSGAVRVSDEENHNLLGRAHSRSLDFPEDGQTALGLGTTEVAPIAVWGVSAAMIASILSSIPMGWRKIPQQQYTARTVDKSFLRFRGVIFSFNGVPGFNMKRALDRAFTGLDGRDEPALEDANGPVSCRIWFPGYLINSGRSQIAVRNWKKKSSPITKSKLAYEVAKRTNQYLNTLSATPISPSADTQWTIGQGCMKIEKMYLVGFSWVSKGSLQPEIWVDVEDA